MFRRHTLRLLPVLLFLFVLLSQTAAQKPHSLEEMVAAAVRDNPSLRVKKAQIIVRNALVDDARNAWLPSVRVGEQVTIGSDNGLSGPYFSLGFVPSISGGRRAENRTDVAMGNLAALVAEWEVYNFGAYQARINEALAGVKTGELDLQRSRYEVQWAVVRQYFELLKYSRLMAVQRKNMERAQDIKQAVGALVNTGLKAGVDTLFAEAELSKMRLGYVDLENAYALIRTQIAMLTGLDMAVITPDTALVRQLPAAQLLAEERSATALQHPSLQYFQAAYEQDRAQVESIRKSFMPKVLLMGVGMLRGSSISPSDVYDENLFNGLNYTRSNYILGAAITYNLIDPVRSNYKREIQESKAEVTRQTLEEQKILLDYSLQRAGLNLQAAGARLREIPLQLKAAEDAYGQKLALYNTGLTNIVELTTALYLVNRSETDAILAADAAWKAVVEKMYAANRLDQFLSTLK